MSQSVPVSPPQPVRRRSGFMRFLRIAAMCLAGLVILVGSCVVLLTKDVTAAGDRFLAGMTGPDPAAAWREAGPDLQRAIGEEAFPKWVADHKLQGATVAFWNSRNRSDSDGSLQGKMTLRDGSTLPLRLRLKRNAAGTWQVIGLSVVEDNT